MRLGSEYMRETQDRRKEAFILNATLLTHAQKKGRLHHVRDLQEGGAALTALRSLAIATAAPRLR